MKQVSITSHIGRAQHDLKSGKDTRINNAADLAAAEKHNNHDYSQSDVDKMESSINLQLKEFNKQFDRNLIQVEHLDLVDTVKQLYHEEFDTAVANYNQKQVLKGHSERQIDDYFNSISDNQKQELAVEGIIQFGDMDDWEGVSIQDRIKTEPILFRGLEEVLKIPGFKLAGVSLHLNESSPHLHYVGICVDDSIKKTGLEKRIGKAKVFTKDILSKVLQDDVRAAMEPLVEEVYGWTFKEKETGRNQDLSKNQLKNKELIEENRMIMQVIDEFKDSADFDKQIEIATLRKEIHQQEATVSRLQALNNKLHRFIQEFIKKLREANYTKIADIIETQYKKAFHNKNKERER